MTTNIDTSSFRVTSVDELEKDAKKNEHNHYQKLRTLREQDIEWRIDRRPYYGVAMLLLLIVQNLVVFGLVVWAFACNKLAEVGYILSIILAATLIETAITVRIIIQWLFSNIDYSTKKYKNK